jgi:hypothetical protein
MKNDVTNSCGNKRGCEITLLPSDKKIEPITGEILYKVYFLSSPIDGSIRYIGITSRSLDIRLKEHIRNAKFRKTYKDNWVKSLIEKGLKPIIEIIDEVIDYKFWESHYISLYKSWNFKLTNSTEGGDNGIVSVESRKKISDKLKGNTNGRFTKGIKKSVPSSWLGKSRGTSLFKGKKRGPKSAEAIKNLSISHFGKNTVAVEQYDLNNNFIFSWDSITKAAEKLKINGNKITMVCKGHRNQTGGYVWKYKN